MVATGPLTRRGFLLTMEGIDGCGKTTQIRLLANALDAKGRRVYVTKEPGDDKIGSSVGAGVRSLLFGKPGTANVAPGVSDLLFLADHIQNTYEIEQHLTEGHVILCDRYADSQFAYAAAPGKKSPEWAGRVYHDQYGVVPNLTLLFIARGDHITTPYVTAGYMSFNLMQGNEDISWALRRANKSDPNKQAGKAWNKVEEQQLVQKAYVENMTGSSHVRAIHVWDKDSSESIHQTVMNIVEPLLDDHYAGE